MDPLSEMLRSVRLTGGVFLDARFSAPWCVVSEITTEDCRPFVDSPRQVIAYHVVIDGRLLLTVPGEPAIEVAAGEVVLLPRNDSHTLAGGPGIAAIAGHTLIQPAADGGLARVRHGGGGESTHIVCGFLASEEASNPMIAALPRLLKLDIREGASREWVEAAVKFAASELTEGRVASRSVMARLSELLLVEAVRNYAVTLGEHESGWLKGLADPQIGRTLALIHGDLGVQWSIERLAREAAMSRSAFVERFTQLVGMPPIRYLTCWRLHTAKLQLRETRRSIADLAHALGYDSEEAFSRAFKRYAGVSPARWRDQECAA
jgi:AraC-like DNA-binding protein